MEKKRRFKSLPAHLFAPRTGSGAVLEPNSSPVTDGVVRTPLSARTLITVGSQKSVLLSDWWLTKVNEKGLGVAGFESKGGCRVRLFSSGEISKRHDSTTLEALDGIRVCVSGLMNRSRALQSGISSEVCNHFLLGFPYNWQDYNVTSCGGDERSVEKHDQIGDSDKDALDNTSYGTNFSISLDDVPVNRLHDLLTSSPIGCLNNKILEDVFDRLRECISQKSERKCEESGKGGDKTVPRVVGVNTRRMLRQKEDKVLMESSIGKRVHTRRKSIREKRLRSD